MLLFSAFKRSAKLERVRVGNYIFKENIAPQEAEVACWFSGFFLKVITVNFKINPMCMMEKKAW